MCGDMELVPVRPEPANADWVGVGEVLNEATLRVQVLNLERVQVTLRTLPHQGYVLQRAQPSSTGGGGASSGIDRQTVGARCQVRNFLLHNFIPVFRPEFFPSRIWIFFISDPRNHIKEFQYFNPKIVSQLSEIGSWLLIRIRIQIIYPSRIPDPGVKKAPDPGSATLFGWIGSIR